jgi:hypothetical protein
VVILFERFFCSLFFCSDIVEPFGKLVRQLHQEFENEEAAEYAVAVYSFLKTNVPSLRCRDLDTCAYNACQCGLTVKKAGGNVLSDQAVDTAGRYRIN